jgi:hypothetical protein
MEKMNSRHAPPRASAMLEALRGLGYSVASAIADIIDNSISAGACNIELRFVWLAEKSRIEIQDDGHGMSAEALDRGMRLGERNPLDGREESDLGRFGLGLKTASFSQCRRLTVATIGMDGLQCLRWDLDALASSEDDGWYLLEGPDPSSADFLLPLTAAKCGTLVLWEQLDRIVTPGFGKQDLLDLIDGIERHLAMTFHRYLESSKQRINLKINGKTILPWDPFLSGLPSKPWHSPIATNPAGPGVEVECHVLPHKDMLSPVEYERAQGPDGWTAQQGFYVYRNKRLLVAGNWLGLGQGRRWTKDEAHRLARIRIDIKNSADAEWKIDIRKSTARPPVELRGWLIRLAEDTRTRARKAFAHRGNVRKGNNTDPIFQAWQAEHFSGGMRYRIDTTHPAIQSVIDLAGALLPEIKAMIRVIEETVPVQRIWLDTAERKETPRTGFSGESPSAVVEVLNVMYRNMIEIKNMSPAMAKDRLSRSDPFHNYPELVASLSDIPSTKDKSQ